MVLTFLMHVFLSILFGYDTQPLMKQKLHSSSSKVPYPYMQKALGIFTATCGAAKKTTDFKSVLFFH